MLVVLDAEETQGKCSHDGTLQEYEFNRANSREIYEYGRAFFTLFKIKNFLKFFF